MSPITTNASMICFAILAGFALAAVQENKPKPAELTKPADQPKPGQDYEKWAKLGEPNEHHARLQKLVGTWTVEFTIPSPDGEMKSIGSAEYKPMHGGRFVTEQVQCDLGGTPFEWFGIYGYDNIKKKYTAVWVDNLGTGFELAEGYAAGDAITFIGETQETPDELFRFKWIVRIEDAGNVKIDMHKIEKDGKEPLQMSMRLRRK